MDILAYIVLLPAFYFLSIRLFNLAMAMGGKVTSESARLDVFFAVSMTAIVWAIHTLFF